MFSLIIGFGFIVSYVSCEHDYGPYSYQPMILTDDGHLTISSGYNGNISLVTQGKGVIYFNDNDLLDIIALVKNATLHNSFGKIRSWMDVLKGMNRDIQSNKKNLLSLSKLFGIKENGTYKPYIKSSALQKLGLSWARIKYKGLSLKVKNMARSMQRNNCLRNQCKHGATCFSIYRKVQCICPTNWKGKFCDVDVDECAVFNGTDLGCQNGATCVNTAGSYKCNCVDGWYGLHCTTKENDCAKAKSEELCGHGICVQDGHGPSCICDQGWTVPSSAIGDGKKLLSCTEDVNECNATVLPCSHDPLVPCINTPGSFECGSCPPGYIGNGRQCADVDECQTDNGGCSTNPFVQCINTRGNSICLTCPPGYSGDGKSCEFTNNYCANDNGGCHRLANCSFNAGLNMVTCHCPSGYVGTGLGTNGCIEDSSAVDGCSSMPCMNNGRCSPLDGGNHTCFCTPYFFGENCEKAHTSCTTNPCQNGGTCVATTYFLRDFWCRCTPGYSGVLCDKRDTECIGHFTAPVGNLTWRPSFHDRDSKWTYKSCSWTIQTGEFQALKVIFTEFSFPSSTPPCTDSSSQALRLKVYDGLSRDSNLIGVYCGNTEPPKLIISSRNSLRFDVEGHLPSSASLNLNWMSIERKCGYDVQVKGRGNIISPKFPGYYPKNSQCEWSLSAPPGKRLKLVFHLLDIGKDVKCGDSYVAISVDEFESMYKFCGTSTPEDMVTPANSAEIVFRSDNTSVGKGFKLEYSEIEGYPGCGGILTDRSGSISLPGLQPSFEFILQCEWKIQVPPYEKIKIQFNDLKLVLTCLFEEIKIYDGPSKKSKLIDRVCENEVPPPFMSTSNILTVVYTFENLHFNKTGLFQISYTTVCEKTLTEESGVIQSPNYPKPYPSDINCVYSISRPAMTSIILSIIDVDMQLNEACDLESLTIYDGNSVEFPVLGKFCGNRSTETLTSTYNMIYLKFSTNNDFSRGRGFYINYTTVQTNCGGIFSKSVGYINNDNFLNVKECTWFIIAKPGHVIHLDWQDYLLQRTDCSKRYLILYTNVTQVTNNPQLGEKYCRHSPPSLTSTSNTIIIKTYSLGSDIFKFKLLYSIEKDTTCVRRLSATTGTITSPNYPKTYPPFLNCEWKITVKSGKQIRLIIKEFYLDDSFNCEEDYLEIRNGETATSPLIGRYCKMIPKEMTSHYNQLYLKFVTNYISYSKGFVISWDGASNGCGGVMDALSGSIVSPNYPYSYGHNADCYWKIVVPVGNKIQLTIVDIDLEPRENCLDFLEIFDGKNKFAKSFGRFCTKAHLQTFTSTSNFLFLKFFSDHYLQGNGFHVTYSTVCNTVLKGHRGSIESPGFHSLGYFYECQWIIDAPLGNRIQIAISHFTMNNFLRGDNCSDNYLQIQERDENGKITTLLDKRCRSETIPEITSNQTRVLINYKTTLFTSENGFRLDWEVVGCGGVFKDKMEGEFSSPGYPNKYNNSMECEWHISVPLKNNIQLQIYDIQLETTFDCENDHLTIYGGKDDSAPKLATLCHPAPGNTPYLVTTTGNNAFVRFVSDFSKTAKGFLASFAVFPDGCGGEFSGYKGIVQSQNYPQNYDPKSDCEYVIRIDNGLKINLTFTDFNIKSNENCADAYVELYDEEYEPLGKFCGSQIPPSTIFPSNLAYIRLKSDGQLSSKGFSANYDTICGKTIELKDMYSQTLESDFLLTNSFMQSVSNCTWTIVSYDPSKHVTLMFSSLQLDPYENSKSKAYIAVYAGYNTSVTPFRNITGNKIPPSIKVPGPVATIIYHQKYGTSFGLDYTLTENACGIYMHAEEGRITSPNYPDNYLPNTECVWTIYLSPGNRVFLYFTEFDIRHTEHCNEDFLEIREARSNKLVGVFCNDTLPETIESNVTLWIIFKSSESGVGKGFVLDFELKIGGTFKGPAGTISSPDYPALHGLTSKVYTWLISASPGSLLRITIEDYDIITSYDDDCEENGGLQIYDGYTSETEIWKAICQVESPFTSRNSAVFIQMRNISPSKFLISWEEIGNTSLSDNACNSTIFISGHQGGNSSYNLSSPGFPDRYSTDLHCTWFIKTDIENHVVIDFKLVDLHNFYECYDNIKVYDLDRNKPPKTICRHTDTKTITGGRTLKVTFDSSEMTGGIGFLATVRVECGGSISEPDGIIKLPAVRNASLDCQWIINAKPGQKVKIEFRKFEFPASNSCISSYVMLRNGKYPESPYLGLGKYCGKTKPPELQSSGNRVFIRFKQESNEEIEIFYQAISPNCKQKLYLSRQDVQSINISTPNYPSLVPPHSICSWVIITNADDSLHFQLSTKLLFPTDNQCEKHYLEVREGSSERGHLIHKFCSHSASFFNTEGNALFVKYFADIPDSTVGFSATVSLSKCGGTIIDHDMTITSPRFPKSYEPDTKCEWIFRNREYGGFQVYFDQFKIANKQEECNNSTSHDILSITEIDTGKQTFFCNAYFDKYSAFFSESPEIKIVFTAQKNTYALEDLGFSLSVYRKQATIGERKNEITSPGYPNGITTISGHHDIWIYYDNRITLMIIDFDWPFSNSTENYVYFYNEKNILITKLNGFQPNGTIVETTSGSMKVVFRCNECEGHRGFKASIIYTNPAKCGGRLNGLNGSMAFSYPNLHSFFCNWNLQIAENMTYSVNIAGNLVKTYDQCEQDTPTFDLTTEDQKFCRSKEHHNYTFYFTTGDVHIQAFGSQPSADQSLNFTLNWTSYACGGLITSSNILLSPGFPNNYKPNIDCLWKFEINDWNPLKIRFNNFTLEDDCDHDYLEITKGQDYSRVLVGREKYCGSIVPADLIAGMQFVLFHLHTDSKNEFQGFNISLVTLPQYCGSFESGYNGVINSENYPNQYKNDAECEFVIHVQDGYHIGIKFSERIQIEKSDNCTNDYLEFFDRVAGTWISIAKICGRESVPPLNSTSNQMKILFRTNHNVTGAGFRLYWNTNCGGVFEASKTPKYINSPGYPIKYAGPFVCNYTIVAETEIIKGHFLDFKLQEETQSICDSDYIEIISWTYNRNSFTRTVSKKYCGTKPPEEIESIRSITIMFVVDRNNDFTGFQLEYFVDECGGKVDEPTEITFSIPPTPDTRTCTWFVTAPKNRIVQISVRILRTICLRQKFQLFNSTLAFNKKDPVKSLCGYTSRKYHPINMKTNEAVIYFFSMFSVSGNSFSIDVFFSYECGGTITLNKNETVSFAIPKDDRAAFACLWEVIAPEDKTIIIKFTDVTMPTPCSINLHVNDGGPDDDDIYMDCLENELQISSTESRITFEAFSHDPLSNVSFNVHLQLYTSPCGKRVLEVTNDIKVLTSPNYPGHYPPGLNCVWLLESNSPFMVLHFEDVDIFDNKCMDYLNVDDVRQGFNRPMEFIGISMYLQSKAPDGFRICKNISSFDYYPNERTVTVKFISGQQVSNHHGFKLTYTAQSCTRNYTNNYGSVNLRTVSKCHLVIQPKEPNRTISIYINLVQFSFKGDCALNALKIYDGLELSNEKILTERCNDALLDPVFSTGPVVTIEFNVNEPGGILEFIYTTTDKGRGCGGTLMGLQGVFTSPLYPNTYRENRTCVWNVETHDKYKIVLEFKELDMGSRETCSSNYVEVYNVANSGDRKKIRTFCGEDQPAIIWGSSKRMEVVFRTTYQNEGQGFNAFYRSEKEMPFSRATVDQS